MDHLLCDYKGWNSDTSTHITSQDIPSNAYNHLEGVMTGRSLDYWLVALTWALGLGIDSASRDQGKGW